MSSWQAGTCRPGSEASRHGPPHTLADCGHPTSLFPHIGHRPSCWAGGGPLVGRFHCAGRGPSAACSSLAPVTGAGDASQAGFSGLRLKPHVARGCYVTLFREGPPFPASQPVSRQLLVWEIRSARLWGRCRGSRGGGHRAGPEPGLQEAAPAGRGILRPAVVRTASLGPPYLEARPARPGLGSSPAPPPPRGSGSGPSPGSEGGTDRPFPEQTVRRQDAGGPRVLVMGGGQRRPRRRAVRYLE